MRKRKTAVALLLGNLILLPSLAQAQPPESAAPDSQRDLTTEVREELSPETVRQDLPQQEAKQVATRVAEDAETASRAARDRQWLTAYFLANEGYALDETELLDAKFANMTPAQLRYLVKFYKRSERRRNRMAEMEERERLFALQRAERYQQRQSQLATRPEPANRGAVKQYLNQAHSEAMANYRQKRAQMFRYQRQLLRNRWGGGPYGGYGYYGNFGPGYYP